MKYFRQLGVFLLVLWGGGVPVRAQIPGNFVDGAFVSRLLVRASRDLNRARETVSLSPSSFHQNLLIQAQDALGAAWIQHSTGNLAAARQLGDRVIDLCDRILESRRVGEAVRRELDRTGRAVESVRKDRQRQGYSEPNRSLEEASRMSREARDEYALGRLETASRKGVMAAKTLEKARAEIVKEAADYGFLNRATATERIRLAEERIRSVERSRIPVVDPLIPRLMAEARRYLDAARGYFDRRLFPAAAANGKLAFRLADHARSLLVPAPDSRAQ